MIGGTDIVIPANGEPSALEACVRIIQQHWRLATFEDALTGAKYSSFRDLPFGCLRELFIYPNASAEAAWDADNAEAEPNTMIYLILSVDSVTAVLDDPSAANMRSILDSVRRILGMDILNTLAEAA